jgi:hypothetical protein
LWFAVFLCCGFATQALASDPPHCVLIEVGHGKDQRTIDVQDRHLYLRRAARGLTPWWSMQCC